MNNWFNERGLIKYKLDEEYPENGFYFTFLYYLLEDNERKSKAAQLAMHQYIREIINPYMMFDNHIIQRWNYPTGNWRYLSQDQLRAYATYLKITEQKDLLQFLWHSMVQRKFFYDNTSPKQNFKRLIHPRDIIYVGYAAGNILCSILLPAFYCMALVSFTKKYHKRLHSHYKNAAWWDKSFSRGPGIINRLYIWLKTGHYCGVNKSIYPSSALVYWMQGELLRCTWHGKLMYKLFDKMIAFNFGSWENVFAAYFGDDHPITMRFKEK